MILEWDERKAQTNLVKHGLSFDSAVRFDLDTALTWVDERTNYGELRQIAIGYLDERLCVMAFTLRGEALRLITLRKANSREVKRYVEFAATR